MPKEKQLQTRHVDRNGGHHAWKAVGVAGYTDQNARRLLTQLEEAPITGAPVLSIRFADGSAREYKLVDRPKTAEEKLAEINSVVDNNARTTRDIVDTVRRILRDA